MTKFFQTGFTGFTRFLGSGVKPQLLILLILLILSKNTVAAPLFIPETSQLTLQNEPLAKGEAAYVESETPGYAQIVVGGDNGKTLRVEDAATVHGYSYEYIPRTEVTIIPGAGISYNGATDKYTAETTTGVVYQITVMVSPEYRIDALEYTEVAYYTDIVEIRNGDISHVINGNVAVISMAREISEGEMSVANIKVRRVLAGNADQVNDLTKLEFTMIDDLGEYSWRSLRYWVTHLYDGNRGEDWARFAAKQRANLNGHGLQLSANNRFAIDVTETQTVFRAAHHDAVVLSATGTGRGYAGAFTAYGPRPTATGVVIPFAADITGFDAASLSVKGGATLDTNSWTTCTASYANGEINVTCSDTYRFFQVFYDGTIMDEFMLTVNAPVKLMNALYLKGEDSVIYQITVNGGAISATAVQ